MAQSLLLSISHYIALEPQLDSWLKPIKLKELGGETARQKAQRELKESERDSLEERRTIKFVRREKTTKEIFKSQAEPKLQMNKPTVKRGNSSFTVTESQTKMVLPSIVKVSPLHYFTAQ